MRRANLSGANLLDADWGEADLRESNLDNLEFNPVDFLETIRVDEEEIGPDVHYISEEFYAW